CDNILGRAFCALGDGATSPITSAIEFFRAEFETGMHTTAWELFPYDRSTVWTDGSGRRVSVTGAHV
ncbi:MAG: NADH-ubiquinone oxidoreductase-F iron-sulfur binding region domain-containing protein, partial [Propionibacteriaceae bacterium]